MEGATDRGGQREARWILLIHHLPPKPAYLRVKVRRHLGRIGAVALKNSVYIMPDTDQALEDAEWLHRLIVDEGGEATVCVAAFVEGVDDLEVVEMFRAQADREYEGIEDAAATAGPNPTPADLKRLRRVLAEVESRDFFGAAGAAAARAAVRELERAVAGRASTPPAEAASTSDVPVGATWVIGSDYSADELASAWLVKRFLDPSATFAVAAPSADEGAVGSAVVFLRDLSGSEADRSAFGLLVERFAPHDRALAVIAEIVEEVELGTRAPGRAETAGVATLIRGLAEKNAGDDTRLEDGMTLFGGLYAAFRNEGTPST